MQHDRRTNPYPWTWEPIVAAIAAYLVSAWILLHLARAVANLTAGAGWQMTGSGQWFAPTISILGGDAAAGLVPTPAEVASPGLLYFWIATFQLALFAASMYALTIWMRRRGPGRMHGTATAAEAEQLLGLRRLRKSAKVIRPDLYGKKAKR